MLFWRLEAPDYRSDYKHTYINGHLEHPFGMPGVDCHVCNATWGGGRTLSHECPPALRTRGHLTDRWPIPLEQHRALQSEVLTHFRAAGVELADLRPGDDFQPCHLDVPSRPRADFLWSSVGTVVVADRIKSVLENEGMSGVSFCPVHLRKIGKRQPTLPAPMPSTGEPEDLILELPLQREPSSVGPYFEMVVLTESRYPPGGGPLSICSGCGRPTSNAQRRRLVMRTSMWRGADIFHLATTRHIVVTEPVKRMLQSLRATNVRLTPYKAA